MWWWMAGQRRWSTPDHRRCRPKFFGGPVARGGAPVLSGGSDIDHHIILIYFYETIKL
jgi:hypothetical protein